LRLTTTRNKLVKKWSKHQPYNAFQKALGSKQYGSGIYILYKGEKPYYVGKSDSSMRERIKTHTKDHHRKKWDNFSFYQVRKIKYVGDIERLLLGYHRPEGNGQGGKFRSKYEIK
jgi:hypothetical protein